jgi:hypothetical protein
VYVCGQSAFFVSRGLRKWKNWNFDFFFHSGAAGFVATNALKIRGADCISNNPGVAPH